MNQLGILILRAPTETDKAPEITNFEATEVILDDGTNVIPSEPPDEHIILEPYFLMMEYSDASGKATRRRVTTRSVDVRAGRSYLTAFCHERQAMRTFRLDRIRCFVSQDGEVEDAAAWFDEILPISIHTVARRRQEKAPEPHRPSISLYTTLRRHISSGLEFLIASARSDDFLHEGEVARILKWAEDEACDLRDAGDLDDQLDEASYSKLERTIRRLRPTRTDLEMARAEIAAWPAARQRRLARALAQTAWADGRVDEIEAALYDDLREEVARTQGLGWDE